MSEHRPPRQSDRWVTPGVIVAFLLVAMVVTLAAMGAITYLAAIGADPDPMVKLVADIVTAVGSLAAAIFTMATRATTTKVERNVNSLGEEVAELRAAEADRTTLWRGAAPAPPRR